MFQNQPEKLWQRYVLAILLIAFTITASHFIATRGSGDSAAIAADVNLSGRQRMLSQRITLFASNFAQAENTDLRSDTLKTLETDLDSFLSSHQILRSRNYLTPEHRDIYSGNGAVQGLDQLIVQFDQAIRQIINQASAGRRDELNQTFLDLQTLATGPLLEELNAAVIAFEQTAQSIEARETRIAHIIFIIALLLLALEAVFIFWPAHRAIRDAISELRAEKRLSDDNRQKAEDALASRMRFFQRIGHDLRTPLNDIVAGADVVKGFDLPQKDKEIVRMIAQSGDDLAEKIRQLLEVSELAKQANPAE